MPAQVPQLLSAAFSSTSSTAGLLCRAANFVLLGRLPHQAADLLTAIGSTYCSRTVKQYSTCSVTRKRSWLPRVTRRKRRVGRRMTSVLRSGSTAVIILRQPTTPGPKRPFLRSSRSSRPKDPAPCVLPLLPVLLRLLPLLPVLLPLLPADLPCSLKPLNLSIAT